MPAIRAAPFRASKTSKLRTPLDWLRILHRHDAYITFMVKGDDPEDGLVDRFAVRMDELGNYWQAIEGKLNRNSYVSINAAVGLADRTSKAAHGRSNHKTSTLRFLCACYCDIDYYKVGLSRTKVHDALEHMRRSGELPPASLLVDSGRGLWIFWLLHDTKSPGRAHLGAYADNRNDHLQLYVRINGHINRLLSHLGADKIGDGARLVRVPGSFRNDTEEYVTWHGLTDFEPPLSYTLKDLAKQLGITQPLPKTPRKNVDAIPKARGRQTNGWQKTNQNRLSALVSLLDQREGGFNRGCRNEGAFLYALSLKWAEVKKRDASEALLHMGECCRPPLSQRQCLDALKQGYRTPRAKVKYQTIADKLVVTPAEAAFISISLFGTTGRFPAAERFGEPLVNRESRRQSGRSQTSVRRDAINLMVNGTPNIPSVRQAQKHLASLGIVAAVGSVHSDYKALGLTAPRKLPGP